MPFFSCLVERNNQHLGNFTLQVPSACRRSSRMGKPPGLRRWTSAGTNLFPMYGVRLDHFRKTLTSDTSFPGPVGAEKAAKLGWSLQEWLQKQPSQGPLKSLKSLTTSEVRDVPQLHGDPWWAWVITRPPAYLSGTSQGSERELGLSGWSCSPSGPAEVVIAQKTPVHAAVLV